jgi:hypothetical protein
LSQAKQDALEVEGAAAELVHLPAQVAALSQIPVPVWLRLPLTQQRPQPARSPLLKTEAVAPQFLMLGAVVAAFAHGHRGYGGRGQGARHVLPVAGSLRIARVQFSELRREPCSFQVAWYQFKSNGFL